MKPSQVRFYTREVRATLEIGDESPETSVTVVRSTQMGHFCHLLGPEKRRIRKV